MKKEQMTTSAQENQLVGGEQIRGKKDRRNTYPREHSNNNYANDFSINDRNSFRYISPEQVVTDVQDMIIAHQQPVVKLTYLSLFNVPENNSSTAESHVGTSEENSDDKLENADQIALEKNPQFPTTQSKNKKQKFHGRFRSGKKMISWLQTQRVRILTGKSKQLLINGMIIDGEEGVGSNSVGAKFEKLANIRVY
eukprot:TRINITY_DN675_c0_g1_i1.p1 TRINITY_DN675_c0_g1~~TRINITY_DN675_c0_g1_i1.p1  ORF type:complete len:196 (+),score=24.07 TRINITY_DN675_c0_g1_i1:109-696(+)